MFRGKERGGKRKGEEREKDGRKRDGGTRERESVVLHTHIRYSRKSTHSIIPSRYQAVKFTTSQSTCTFTTVHTTRTTHIHTQPPKSQGIDSFSMCMKTATK